MSTIAVEPYVIERASSLAKRRMSYEEFLVWAQDKYVEWVDGEVIEFMSVKLYHQSVVDFLAALLRMYTHLFELGVVKTAPYQMRLMRSGREPDVMFMSNETYKRATDSYLDGAADLVIEVVSEGSVGRDNRDKYIEYEAEGITEYWIIDPRPGKLWAEFFVLDENGKYVLQADDESERFHSTVIDGLWIKPEWLWTGDENDVLLCLAEMGATSAIKKRLDEISD